LIDPQQILRVLDPTDEVAYEEALTLISQAGEGVFSQLCQALQSSLNPVRTREAAAWVLGDLHFAHAASVLIDTAQDSNSSDRLRATISSVLGRVDDPAVPDALATLARDPFSDVRRAAVNALHEHPGDRPLPVVIGALRDPESSVRSAAAYALEAFDSSRSIGPLMEALRDPDPAVRGNAASSLAAQQAEVAAPSLCQLTSDVFPYPRSSAAAALGTLEYQPAVSRLCELLQDPVQSVRRAAIRSLERLENADSRDAVADAVQDSDAEVQTCAERLLQVLEQRSLAHSTR
jgi:bilin biosynthesis protein